MSSKSEDRDNGVSVETLVISSVAAGAAAVVVPLFWEQGTVIATAVTPVIVALISEAVRRPVDRIGAVASPVVRKDGTADPSPEGADEKPGREDRHGQQPLGARRRRRRLKIALITGVLAFGVAVVVVTVSELAVGGSVSGDDRTTIFGGKSQGKSEEGKPEQQQGDQRLDNTTPETTPTETTPTETTPTETNEKTTTSTEPAP